MSGSQGGDPTEWALRVAREADIASICAFGEAHIRPHYAPLIGADAADLQVKNWWNETQIRRAVKDGLVTVAEAAGCVIGVAQRGRYGSAHVLFKLYVDPAYRGRGLGSDLVSNVIDRLRPEAERLCVEHFAGNVRAAAFYEREGFFVERVEPHGASPALDVVWRARKL